MKTLPAGWTYRYHESKSVELKNKPLLLLGPNQLCPFTGRSTQRVIAEVDAESCAPSVRWTIHLPGNNKMWGVAKTQKEAVKEVQTIRKNVPTT